MSTAELRLRYATVDFSHAVFEYPLTIAGEAAPFLLADSQALDEQAVAGTDATVRMVSLRGVDAAHLVLADVDLTRAPVYRALRKGFEDGKNEPGAADFYYGEMEMRHRDRTGTTRAERGLLHGCWLLSGYGLRAVRALGWLAVAMAGAITVTSTPKHP
ncbi:hypothetical protein [Streptomyces sp. CB01635]|uniref:hypothetical protein n=1 Tax=unclassified Streptomyces TaxID=2593676 RepID=UPI001F257A07|nr:hypothetical protein [Streptomyces sp. CB01635]